MDTTLIIVLSIIGLFVLFQLFSVRKAKSVIGTPAPDLTSVDAGIDHDCKVLFFHAPGCRACKSMMPMIEKMQQQYHNLISVDITQHLMLARQFKLAGTPSIFVIRDGQITDVKLGSVSEDWLNQQLA